MERKSQCKTLFFLTYQSLGFLFGDISLSPLYVYQSIFSGRLKHVQNEDAIFGSFSLIFWTLSLISLLKYAVFMLSADDNGEGKDYYSVSFDPPCPLPFQRSFLLLDLVVLSIQLVQGELLLCIHTFAEMQNFACFLIIKHLMRSYLHIANLVTQIEIYHHHL